MSAAAIPVHAAKTGCLVGYFDAARVPRIAVDNMYVFPRGGDMTVKAGRQIAENGATIKLWVERAADLHGVAGFSLE